MNLHLGVGLNDGLSVYGDLRVTGSRSDRDFNSFPATPVKLPGFALLSVGGRWEIFPSAQRSSRIALDARVENLLDVEFQEVFGFQAPGRGLYVGLNINFGGRGEIP